MSFILHTTEWNKDVFFNNVKSMDHHYKGIHPIRINEESLQFLHLFTFQTPIIYKSIL